MLRRGTVSKKGLKPSADENEEEDDKKATQIAIDADDMAGTKRGRSKQTKRKTKRKKQTGGSNPFQVDFKGGIRVTKDMIKAVKTPIDKEKAKRTVQGYKREYQAYKRRGGSKSYNSWIVDKGYGERRPEGCIM